MFCKRGMKEDTGGGGHEGRGRQSEIIVKQVCTQPNIREDDDRYTMRARVGGRYDVQIPVEPAAAMI